MGSCPASQTTRRIRGISWPSCTSPSHSLAILLPRKPSLHQNANYVESLWDLPISPSSAYEPRGREREPKIRSTRPEASVNCMHFAKGECGEPISGYCIAVPPSRVHQVWGRPSLPFAFLLT